MIGSWEEGLNVISLRVSHLSVVVVSVDVVEYDKPLTVPFKR